MNPDASKLLERVNEKLKQSPLFYFSRDMERSLGLENLLENYFCVSIDSSYITDSLKERAFALSSNDLQSDSTLELVKNQKVVEWVKQKSGGKFYAQLFQFNQPAIKALESYGGTVLNNPAELNRKFEAKISQFQIFKDNNIPMSKSIVANISETSWQSLTLELGNSFVIQEDRAHTGSGTYFVSSEIEFTEVQKKLNGNNVRIAKFIDAHSYTVNGCVTKKGIFVAGLQYQITGIAQLTPGKGSTIGNDWTHGFRSLSENARKQIFEITKKLGEIMQKDGYKGLFGVDLLVSGEEIFVIEVNARQTANISLQTKLEIQQNQIPLSLINLAEWLDIDLEGIEPSSQLVELQGSQIFLRSKTDNFEIREELKSGIYRLQSDNEATKKIEEQGAWVQNQVIYIDEEEDKPLIWQKEGYNVDEIGEGGFVMLVQKKGLIKNKFDELARFQFINQIVFLDGIAPWILEALKAIEDRIR